MDRIMLVEFIKKEKFLQGKQGSPCQPWISPGWPWFPLGG